MTSLRLRSGNVLFPGILIAPLNCIILLSDNTMATANAFMYILRCADGSYYTGSTNNIEARMCHHQNGEGANFTRKHLPVELIYQEEFQRLEDAFRREKQVQGWSRQKKEALINGTLGKLHELSQCKNQSHSKNIRLE